MAIIITTSTDDTWYHEVTLNDPTYDVTPFDLLHRLSKRFVCTPGTCGNYASPSYELLGLALVHVHNLSRWEDLDQRDVVKVGRVSEWVGGCEGESV